MKHLDDVAVFWDYENCPVPANVSGYTIVNNIRAVVQSFGSVNSLKAYLEISDSLNLRSELQCSGVSLIDCPRNGRKDVADKMIIADMFAYAIDNPAPSTIVLISGDRDFAYALSILRLRRYKIVLITLTNAHASLVSQVCPNFCYDWTLDILGTSPSPPKGKVHSPLQSRQAHLDLPPPPTLSASGSKQRQLEDEDSVDLAPYLRQRIQNQSDMNAQQTPSSTAYEPAHTSPAQGSTTMSEKVANNTWWATPPYEQAPVNTAPTGGATSKIQFGATTEGLGLGSPIEGISVRPPTQTSFKSQDVIIDNTVTNDQQLLNAQSVPPSFTKPAPILWSSVASSSSNTPTVAPDVTWAPPSMPATPTTKPIIPNTSVTKTQHFTPPTPVKVTTPLPKPQTVPPHFRILVKTLKTHQSRGFVRPLRSVVALEIAQAEPTAYKNAGVSRFGQYIALAEKENIIKLGGKDGADWISLKPEWSNVPSGY